MMIDSSDPVLFYGVAAAVGVLFVFTVVGMWRSGRALRAYNRDLRARLDGLRIGRMLGRLGVSRARFLRKTSPINVERRMLACERCADLDPCDRYLAGEDLDARTFCPNYVALERLTDPGPEAGFARPARAAGPDIAAAEHG